MRRSTLPLIALLLGVPLVIGIAAAVFVRLVPRPSCANEVRSEQISADGAHRAVAFLRNCGATTPYTTNVSILPAGAPLPDEAGNVLVLRDTHEVALEWSDPTHIVVRYPRGADAFLEAREIAGVEAILEPGSIRPPGGPSR